MPVDPAILALARALGRRAGARPDVVFQVGDPGQPLPVVEGLDLPKRKPKPAGKPARKPRRNPRE